MAEITKEEVAKLAKLARVGLSPEEIEALSTQMGEILDYVKQLDEIDTSSVEPTSQVTGLSNVLSTDEVKDCDLSRDELLANAPQRENGYIKVKSVLG